MSARSSTSSVARSPASWARPGSYPVDIRIDPPGPLSRWRTLFRLFLAIPAFAVSAAYGGIAFVIAVLGWVSSLARGRMPEGMRNLGAVSLRYQAQTTAYFLLLTDRYPYAAPALEDTTVEIEEIGLAPEPA